ncbi:AsmA family protein [Celerinatantimonas sp. YJH-8]|uniref:AsmA family protein n=1 Tax=Celerinatantimonas sp. YJH-8 TaxID=3228714 RepID=UPI0038BF3AAC
MRSILKWVLAVIIVLIVIIAAALWLVDPNQFKPQIEQQVTQLTGRTFTIDGPISWQLLPSVGIELKDVKLMNPAGYPERPMAQLGELDLSLAVFPLLRGQLEIGNVTLKQAHVEIIKRAHGKSNLDGLTGSATATHASASTTSLKPAKTATASQATAANVDKSSSSVALSDLSIASVDIEDVQLLLRDETTHSEQSLQVQSLQLGRFQLGQNSPFSFVILAKSDQAAATLKGKGQLQVDQKLNTIQMEPLQLNVNITGDALPQKQLDGQLTGHIKVTLQPLIARLDLSQISFDKITGKGSVTADLTNIPELNASLSLGQIDLNRYLKPADSTAPAASKAATVNTETTSHSSAASTNRPLSDQEPDLSFLQSFNGQLNIDIQQVLYQKGSVGPITLQAQVKDGVASVSKANVQLYKGAVNVTGTLDSKSKHPDYQGDLTIKGIQLLPLLQDFAKVDLLSGELNSSVKIDGKGLSELRLQRDSVASGHFGLKDGAYHGANIGLLIRNTYHQLKGQKTEQTTTSNQSTEFTSLTGDFTKKDYRVTNSSLVMESALLKMNMHGKGTYQLDNQHIDYQLQVAVNGSLDGTAKNNIDALKNVTIPLEVTGTAPDHIKYKVDLKDVLKQEVKQQVNVEKKKLKKKVEHEKDKLLDKLKNKLGNGLPFKL